MSDPRDDRVDEREALLERIRTLRLWADHLEDLLAQRAEQVDIWRERAEARKQRIARLEERLASPTKRRPWRNRSRTGKAADVARKDVPTPRPIQEDVEGPGSTRSRPLIHPTVRVGVIAPESTEVPALLARMNMTRISDASSGQLVRASDVLIIIGDEGESLARESETVTEWIRQEQPVVHLSTEGTHAASLTTADLTYFDETEDVFGVQPASIGPDTDPDLEPTLHRIGASPESSRMREILAGATGEGSTAADERVVVRKLRELRATSSPQVVGERLLEVAGVTVPTWRPEALAVLLSRRSDFVIDAVKRMVSQTYRPFRVAIGLHGEAADAEREMRHILESSSIPHAIHLFDTAIPQGACLNALIASSPGDVLLKIDDDDLYSPVFVEDMVGALMYSGASIVGKASTFVRLRQGNHVLLRNGFYKEVGHVVGPTITARRSAWEVVRFPHRHERVDSKFLQAAGTSGLTIVTHHPWDFCVIRHDQGHSWTASDEYFLAAGRGVDLTWPDMQTT